MKTLLILLLTLAVAIASDVIVYDPLALAVPNRVTQYAKSVDTEQWIAQPNVLINPVVPATGAYTEWKVVGGTTVVEMTQQEKDDLALATSNADIATSKSTAKTFYDATIPQARMARGICHSLLDEVNELRKIVVGVAAASVSYDPPSLADKAGATSSPITMSGARFGDFVDVAAPYDLAGLVCIGYVSAPDTVKIRLHNLTGTIVNLGPGNWTIAARRIPGVLPPKTTDENRTAIHAKIDAEP
jgi:hypothetical protein